MVLQLHVAGPGLDVVRRIEAGDTELVLGRDADCSVCLPDPQRNVSRRHLSMWLEDEELHFRVLSVVNGVEMPFGEAPPGARGVLPLGQTLRVADYSVSATLAPASTTAPQQTPAPADPWAVLNRDGSDVSPVQAVQRVSLASGQTGGFSAPPSAEDDPFGDWGFETTFGPPNVVGAARQDADPVESGDLAAFFEGLGLDGAFIGAFGADESEALGRLVRTMVMGLLELHASVAGVKKDLRSEDRTMVAVRDSNPLKTDWPEEIKLRFLFGARVSGVGFVTPERAVRELLVELIAHNNASAAASRSALESTLREFAPDALKARFLGEGPKLFEGIRTWDAYTRYYQEQGQDMPKWAQRLLDKYFTEAYLRESVRIRRETPSRKR